MLLVQVSEKSGLEQDLGATIQMVKAKRAAQETQAEALMYARNPYSMKKALPGQALPLPLVCVLYLCV